MRWLSIDPGETTGWALWDDEDLLEAGQTPLRQFIDGVYQALVAPESVPPGLSPAYEGVGRLVVEDWQLYPWKSKELAWDYCRTARGIGALELIARLAGIELVLQPAAIKERAEAAGAENLFVHPLHENRHANDAIRHGVYYMTDPEAPPPGTVVAGEGSAR